MGISIPPLFYWPIRASPRTSERLRESRRRDPPGVTRAPKFDPKSIFTSSRSPESHGLGKSGEHFENSAPPGLCVSVPAIIFLGPRISASHRTRSVGPHPVAWIRKKARSGKIFRKVPALGGDRTEMSFRRKVSIYRIALCGLGPRSPVSPFSRTAAVLAGTSFRRPVSFP